MPTTARKLLAADHTATDALAYAYGAAVCLGRGRAMAWERCITAIKEAVGRDFSDGEMERIIEDILDRKARSRSPALSDEETLAAAA